MLNRTFLVPLSTLTSHSTEQVLLPHFPKTSINGQCYQRKLIKTKFLKKVLMQKQSMYMMGICEIGVINIGMATKIIKRYGLSNNVTSVLVLKCIFEQQPLCSEF
jgi:hypothetical protein